MTDSTTEVSVSKTAVSAAVSPKNESADDNGAKNLAGNDSSSTGESESIDLGNELIDTSKIDDVLTRKMALVNAAIDEIGMTPFQWKLFFLNGYGYAVDSVS